MWKYLLIFVGGALMGSASTYLLTKKKYESEAQKEIEEVRNIYFEKCRKRENIDKMNAKKDLLMDHVDTMKSITSTYGYSEEETQEDLEEPDEEDKWEAERINPVEHPSDPYSITPHDFAYANRHYDKITLLYYPSEEVLINEIEGMEEDINQTIGKDALSKFGEFEEDVAYIRNDRLGVDYEVILQPKTSHYIFDEEE